MDAAYCIQPLLPFLSHWNHHPTVFGDYISVDSNTIDVRIKSGEYFITLATMIEVLSQRPASQRAGLTDELEQVANELLYLQNYYEIIKKQPLKADESEPAPTI